MSVALREEKAWDLRPNWGYMNISQKYLQLFDSAYFEYDSTTLLGLALACASENLSS